MTDELVCTVLVFGGPLVRCDAVVVLCGGDFMPRLKTGVELFRSGGGDTMVLTGGIDRPPKFVGAERAQGRIMALGVAPDRVIVEPTARNTREQAVEVVELARLNNWKRLALVASGWHIVRAFLTFLARLQEVNCADTIQLVPVPETAQPWSAMPVGHERTRLDLLADEAQKVLLYQTRGHAASYTDGVGYLQHWEQATHRAASATLVRDEEAS